MTLLKEAAKELGKLGGDKTKEKYGLEFYKKISQKAAILRTMKAKEKRKKLEI